MRQRNRKLVGTIVLVVGLAVYALVAMAVSVRLPTWSGPVQAIYYAVAGLLWVLPAGLVITWMQRPDSGS